MSAQKLSLLFSTIILSLLILGNPVNVSQAVESLSVVRTYEIQDTNAKPGDIVSRYTQEGIISLSKLNANQELLGVIVERSETISYYEESATSLPVASTGIYKVNVNSSSGPIAIGDYVAISPVDGIGQKEERDTQLIVGRAVENFDAQTENGQILVDLGKTPGKYDTGTLRSIYQLGKYFGVDILRLFQTTEGASQLFRYLIALAIMIGVSFLVFRHFGHSISKGIEAIGRNPLARNNILSGILLNAVMIIVVILLIVILSIVIIRL